MPYQPTKPAPNDLLSNSVNDIQQNFLISNNVMNVNHFPFDNVTANKGKHKFVAIPVAAAPAGVAGDGNIYANTAISVSPSTESNMFYTPDAAGRIYQMTRTIDSKYSSFGTNPGWSFLPGGLLIQWGTSNSASGTTITFPVAFTSIAYNVQCTVNQNTTNRHFAYARNITASNFISVQLDSGGVAETNIFSWVAIGK